MPRVVSKNLFNFKPVGQIDADVKAIEDQRIISPHVKEMLNTMKKLELKDDSESTEEFYCLFRRAIRAYVESLNYWEHKAFEYGILQTLTEHIKVRTKHDGLFEVQVGVYIPKVIRREKNRGVLIYAHGGGCIALSANAVIVPTKCLAVDMNVVVFNVHYRPGPETRCPNNIKDFYAVIKYVSENAEKLKIDPSKIVITGVDGGGYICLGAMVLLAENNETNLVRLAIPTAPMVDDYCFSDPLVMTEEERKSSLTMRKIWRDLIAEDFEQQRRSPYLFPGKASDELMEKFPPTIIIESEFGSHITEASRLANRLRRVGRLMEFVVIPGATQTFCWHPEIKSYKMLVDIFKSISQEYINC